MAKHKHSDEGQKHKKHNSKSDKLKKKHELKKNRRKFKEERSQHRAIRKEKEKLQKLKLSSEAFNSKVSAEDIYTVRKVIGKLIAHSHDSINELPQLFEMLDDGYEVDLSGLQDSYAMQKLNKVFKCLKLKRDEQNKLEFRKKEGLHDFKLKQLIQHYIDEAVDAKSDDSASSGASGSDSESEDESDDRRRKRSRSRSSSREQAVKKPAQSRLDALNQKINAIQYQEVPKQKIEESSSEEEVGPKFEEGQEFLDSTLKILGQSEGQEVAPSKELENELNRMFSAASQKRPKGPQMPPEKEINSNLYLGVVDKKLTEEEEEKRQEAISEYMQEYNSHFRQKSLLEEHQEKAKGKKQADKRSRQDQVKDFMSRPFDREKDLRAGGIDSSKAFSVINKNNLDKRFGQGSRFL